MNTNFFVGLIMAFVFNVLERVKAGLFDELCTTANGAIANAEAAWYGQSGMGVVKKDWVMAQCMAWVDARVPLSWVQRILFKSAMSIFVSSLVTEINEALGKNWVEKAKELEAKIGLALGIDQPSPVPAAPMAGNPETPRAPGATVTGY